MGWRQLTSSLPSSEASLTLCAPSMTLMEEAPLAQCAAVSTHLEGTSWSL